MVTVGASSAAAQGCSLLQAWETPASHSLPRPHLEEQLQVVGEGSAAQISASDGCQTLLVVIVVAQLCLTLCVPRVLNFPGSCIRGVSQTKILEQIASSFSRGSSRPRDPTRVSFFTTELPGKPCGEHKNFISFSFLICKIETTLLPSWGVSSFAHAAGAKYHTQTGLSHTREGSVLRLCPWLADSYLLSVSLHNIVPLCLSFCPNVPFF